MKPFTILFLQSYIHHPGIPVIRENLCLYYAKFHGVSLLHIKQAHAWALFSFLEQIRSGAYSPEVTVAGNMASSQLGSSSPTQ